jgi:hypothetical protein
VETTFRTIVFLPELSRTNEGQAQCPSSNASQSCVLTQRGQWIAADFLLEFSRTANQLRDKELGEMAFWENTS